MDLNKKIGSFDVAVIGAGVIGSSAAYNLTKLAKKKKIVLVEQVRNLVHISDHIVNGLELPVMSNKCSIPFCCIIKVIAKCTCDRPMAKLILQKYYVFGSIYKVLI